MLCVSSKIIDFEKGSSSVSDLVPVVLTKVGNFTKCVYRSWMPKVIEESISKHVLEKDPNAGICKVETDHDLALSDKELRMCMYELIKLYVERICASSAEIALPRSAWYETEEDGGDKYAQVSILAINPSTQMAKFKFLSGPMEGEIVEDYLGNFPLEWLDDLLH